MPLTSTADLLHAAYAAGTAIAAFNVVTLEHAEAIAIGAERAGHPVIMQFSQNCARYHGDDLRPLVAASAAIAQDARTPLSLHLDHIDDQQILHDTRVIGASSVMFDAARLDYEANVDATRAAARWAHGEELLCEAELGEVGGKRGAHDPRVRTDPAEAADFVARTGVDALAVAVGSSHAMTSATAALDLDLVAVLRRAVGVPLVLHGSSGVPSDQLQGAVRAGITKVNIGTALNVAFTDGARTALSADGDLVDPRRYLDRARKQTADAVARHLDVLASS